MCLSHDSLNPVHAWLFFLCFFFNLNFLWGSFCKFLIHSQEKIWFIAELAECSPIIIQNSSNPSSQKNLVVRLYTHTTVRPYKVLLLTCMVNCTTGMPMPWLCPVVQWSVHWAPSRTTWGLVLARTRRCALATCGKKNASSAFRLG